MKLFYKGILRIISLFNVLFISFTLENYVKYSQKNFIYSFKTWLEEQCVDYTEISDDLGINNNLNMYENYKNPILSIKTKNLNNFLVHVIPSPESLEMIQPSEQSHLLTTLTDKNVIHLHEDVWQRCKPIVKSRLLSKIGDYKSRIFARKCIVKRIDKNTAIKYLEENHLWGATNAKYNYALFYNNDIVACTSFSPRRHVKRGKSGTIFRSHELIRFCTSLGITVVGGLSKLIKAFIREHSPDDIITTIDRDFGSIDSWKSLGFQNVMTHPPLPMVIDKNRPGLRLYLLGSGLGEYPLNIKDDKDLFSSRFTLPSSLLEELDKQSYGDQLKINADTARRCLSEHGYFLVYDAGVSRMFLPLHHNHYHQQQQKQKQQEGEGKNSKHEVNDNDEQNHNIIIKNDVMELWQESIPSFPFQYYSTNAGVRALIEEAAHYFPITSG